CSGIVEVNLHGQWGTVCDDGWDMRAANVVCLELGCGFAEFSHDAKFGPGSGMIALNSVTCTGHESSLIHCDLSLNKNSFCTHENDAGVKCTGRTTASNIFWFYKKQTNWFSPVLRWIYSSPCWRKRSRGRRPRRGRRKTEATAERGGSTSPAPGPSDPTSRAPHGGTSSCRWTGCRTWRACGANDRRWASENAGSGRSLTWMVEAKTTKSRAANRVQSDEFIFKSCL
uniref:SRCR domain-containing protein n=1 Tax=Kryptolebias marmoratus TaxID=37003 RepID=A0A3Q3B0F5_KRYMA